MRKVWILFLSGLVFYSLKKFDQILENLVRHLQKKVVIGSGKIHLRNSVFTCRMKWHGSTKLLRMFSICNVRELSCQSLLKTDQRDMRKMQWKVSPFVRVDISFSKALFQITLQGSTLEIVTRMVKRLWK